MPANTLPELTKIESVACKLLRFTNEHPAPKWLQYKFLRTVGQALVYRTVSRRLYLDGAEKIIHLNPDRGVVLATNHRTFFDQYIAMLGLYEAGLSWTRKMFFPVRSNFFYEHPAGIALNLFVTGGTMYPPIFRGAHKAAMNRQSLDCLIDYLQDPQALVGVHPEGTRGKGEDPYEILPAQPGIGEIILKSKAIVIPLFINGMSNHFISQVRKNYQPGVQNTDPVIACFGDPVDYSEFATKKPRAALYKQTADRVRDAIVLLGQRERALRADCLSGVIPDDAPGWIYSHHSTN